MNTNLPIPIETVSVAYMRPYKNEKSSSLRYFLILVLIIVFLTGAVCVYLCLPENIKQQMNGWFSSETTVEETTGSPVTDGTTAPPTETTNIYQYDVELPQGATAILPTDHSANKLLLYAENPTDAILESVAPSFPKKSGEISVLIVNTHSFEGYAEDGMSYFSDASFASNGAEELRVAAIAEALCTTLNKQGIGAKFMDCMATSGFGSYENAKKLCELALKEHPKTVLVIDIHRAILMDEKGALLRPITEIAGEIAAQARILLGSDAAFEKNAAVALSFYETVNLTYPSLMMPLCVSENRFLQTLPVPVLTLEVGSAGNSVAEAEQTAHLLANIIAQKMKQ